MELYLRQIEQLVALQQVDHEIYNIKKELARAPQEIEELETEFSGLEERRARVYCPRWVGLFRWLKPVLSTRLAEAPIRRVAANLLPRMDAEVAALGRSTSAYTGRIESI